MYRSATLRDIFYIVQCKIVEGECACTAIQDSELSVSNRLAVVYPWQYRAGPWLSPNLARLRKSFSVVPAEFREVKKTIPPKIKIGEPWATRLFDLMEKRRQAYEIVRCPAVNEKMRAECFVRVCPELLACLLRRLTVPSEMR